MPAFFNGVFGHKPTGGLVPGTGQYPFPENEACRYLSTGPLCRRAEDLMPLLRILAGPDGQDPGCEERALHDPAEVSMAGLRVVVVEGNGIQPVSSDLRRALHRAADALAAQGATLERKSLRKLALSMPVWTSMMALSRGQTFGEMLGCGEAVRPFRELARWAVRRSDYTFPALGLAALEVLASPAVGLMKRFATVGRELKRELTEMVGPRGVLLYPPFPAVAPRHVWPQLTPFHFVYPALFNVLEMPVTQVPLGLNRDRLPLGVQVAAIPGNDHLTIAVAQALEWSLGGWVPPWTRS